MEQLDTFNDVMDSQIIFRTILDCLANPGHRCSIKAESDKLFGVHKNLLAFARTFLDAEVSYYVSGLDKESLKEDIILFTHADSKNVEEADYIFATESTDLNEIIARCKEGTLVDPHKSASLIIELSEDCVCQKIRLYGPGIKDSIVIDVEPEVINALKQRDAQQYEYPQGIDLFFISKEGQVLCIPRMVRMEEV